MPMTGASTHEFPCATKRRGRRERVADAARFARKVKANQ